MRKKNRIPKYYVFSLKISMRIIYEQSINEKPYNSIKYWDRKPKNLGSVIGKKPPNLQVRYFKEKNREKGSKKEV